MPSSFSPNSGLELPANGEQVGLWGETTNLNMQILDRQLTGSTTIGLTGTTHTLTTSAGTLSDGQYAAIAFSGTLGAANTVTIAPNTAQRLYFLRNSTNQDVIITQGSGGDVTIPAGNSAIVYTTGGGGTAAVINITTALAMGNVRISGGTITGITDLAVADGGTGASTAAQALINLGLTATAAEMNVLAGAGVDSDDMAQLAGVNDPGTQGFIPVGGIIMWSGSVASVPAGWALCNGANGTPDLTNRFIVGAGGTYAPGDTGGADSVTLTTGQLPSHTHGFSATTDSQGGHSHTGSTSSNGNHSHSSSDGGGFLTTFGGEFNFGAGSAVFTGVRNTNTTGAHTHTVTTDTAGAHTHTVSGTSDSAGSGSSHENRPPYYALAYIMKI